MIKFQFDANAYRQAAQHQLIPPGNYRAKITGVSVKNMPDGSVILRLEFLTTYKALSFSDNLFLNPPGHMYYESSNKRFGDLCVSCGVGPVDVLNDENVLVNRICGIELQHKQGKQGGVVFNSVKKFLPPNVTEGLREFGAQQSQPENFTKDTVINDSAVDFNNPDTWFSAK